MRADAGSESKLFFSRGGSEVAGGVFRPHRYCQVFGGSQALMNTDIAKLQIVKEESTDESVDLRRARMQLLRRKIAHRAVDGDVVAACRTTRSVTSLMQLSRDFVYESASLVAAV
jgi:hypothetical protein